MEIAHKVIETTHGNCTFVPPLIEIIQQETGWCTNIHQLMSESDVIYRVLATCIERPFSRRIALYLPFRLMKNAPDYFKKVYMKAWTKLLFTADVRENFHLGDCFELDARPEGHSEYVVKATHLTPWLLKYGYLTGDQLIDILSDGQLRQPLILQGFSEAMEVVEAWGCPNVSRLHLSAIKQLLESAPHRIPLRPLYISEKRKQWLKDLSDLKQYTTLLYPDANLTGPFSKNLSGEELRNLAENLAPHQIILIGGSRLKGYASTSSDCDILDYDGIAHPPITSDFNTRIGSMHATHIYLGYAWLAGPKVDNLERTINMVRTIYSEDYVRRYRHLERLESSLLQYRLLHSGYVRVSGKTSFETSQFAAIDGDCAFYDDGYRTIATEIFAKYIHIPD